MQKDRARMLELAGVIGHQEQAILKLENELYWLKQDLENAQEVLAPEGGWPGSNDTTRKAAADKAKADKKASREVQELILNIRNKAGSLAELQGLQAVAEAERRAIEYGIRDLLATVLTTGEEDVIQDKVQIDNLAKAILTEPAKSAQTAPKQQAPAPAVDQYAAANPNAWVAADDLTSVEDFFGPSVSTTGSRPATESEITAAEQLAADTTAEAPLPDDEMDRAKEISGVEQFVAEEQHWAENGSPLPGLPPAAPAPEPTYDPPF